MNVFLSWADGGMIERKKGTRKMAKEKLQRKIAKGPD